jgi:hypothetical protein
MCFFQEPENCFLMKHTSVYLTQYFKIVILTYCFKILSFGNTIYACIMQHLRILLINTAIIMRGCRDRDRMVFG